MDETDRQAERMARATERKIEALTHVLQGDGRGPVLTGKALRQILAEIAQEFGQPLQIITSAVSMLGKSGAGRFDANGKELLRMADEAGRRMTHLIQCMIRIAGSPSFVRADKAVLDALYNAADVAPH